LSRRSAFASSGQYRIILLLTDGHSYSTICERVDCTPQTIATWKARYEADGLAGLRGRHRGSKARVLTPQVEGWILSWTRKPPTDGTTHWSTRRPGDRLGVPHLTRLSSARGNGLACSRIDWSATGDRPIPTSKRRRRRSFASSAESVGR
jgi:hypothetical protein